MSPGLYDPAQWQRLWERAVADPVGERAAASAPKEERAPAEAPSVAGVCPYRGLASYRQQDAGWFFGRERSTEALVAQLVLQIEAALARRGDLADRRHIVLDQPLRALEPVARRA